MTKAGETRPYQSGEDRKKALAGVIVCQGPTGTRAGICGRDVRKLGRYKLKGGWYDVYECVYAGSPHRFGIRGAITEAKGGLSDGKTRGTLTVIDVATTKAVFGAGRDNLGF